MKFFLISKCGEGGHLLYKIAQEGNDVRLYIKEKDYRRCWKGILGQIELHDSWIDKDTVILFDSSGMGDLADSLKKSGHFVLGSSAFADKIETDREFGLDTMSRCGIQVPMSINFKSNEWIEALDFLEGSKEKRYVFKPSGDLPSRLTYCPMDTEDLIHYMKFVRAFYGARVKEFVLQEFIEGSIVSSEYWCDGKHFIHPVNQTVEVKKLMNDDIGPSTGCSGNLVWLGDDSSKVVESGIKAVESLCVKEGFAGPIDLNTIINEDGIFGLEWTPRFGLDALPTFIQLLDCDLGELFYDIARGQHKGVMSVIDAFAGGVRLTIPPYPLEPKKVDIVQDVSPNLGIPLRGLPMKYSDNYWFYEIMMENKELVHADGTGVIAVISDSAEEPEDSFKLPYEILESVMIPDKQYRTDLGTVLPRMYEKVRESETCLQ